MIRSIGKLYYGRIVNHPTVETFRGKSMVVESGKLIHQEADGESLGHALIPFDIIPPEVRVIAGEDFKPAPLSA